MADLYVIAQMEQETVSINSTDYSFQVMYSTRDQLGPTSYLYRIITVTIPLDTNAHKANRLTREAIAADLLSNHSLTIDPEDIFIPLQN